jgi:hypothetical protein
VGKKGKRRKDRDQTGARAPEAAPELLRPLVVARAAEDDLCGRDLEPAAADAVARSALDPLGPLGRLGGARLCFGDAVVAGQRAVVPVARVSMAGGWGGGTDADSSQGSGGGGLLGARAVGYIEVDADGSRYVPIAKVRSPLRALAGAALAGVAGAALALAAARARHPRRRGRRWLSR